MKKDKNIGELLGMQQEEMAMLLRVTRSQWAMYVSGQRGLPPEAQLKLAEMFAFIAQLDKEEKVALPPAKQQGSKKNNFWEGKLIDNQLNQARVAAILKKYKDKYEQAMIAWKLSNFLSTKEQETKWEQELLQHIKNRAEAVMQKNGLELQEQYEFKLRLLQHEELLLNEKLSGK
ncbi:hypothetical protein [Flavobacterium sp. CLA17]|uniref:hypothetical protein n=1 Tax=Flavobacterium sp. CLA17 TaxID=2724135 RepID=UPI0014911F27|nr:hypothetical protein [Flavobacterium sp. CLA17]QSB29091.1 hypothetical protein HAV12_010235 [Flavobacterium sp. CLA17]